MLVQDFFFKDISSVGPNTCISYLVKVMARKRRDILPVVDNNNIYLAMIGIDEILNYALPDYYNLLNTVAFMPENDKLLEGLDKINYKPVSLIMKKYPTIKETDTITMTTNLMLKDSLKAVPVIKDKKLIGVVNRIDILSYLVAEKKISHNSGLFC